MSLTTNVETTFSVSHGVSGNKYNVSFILLIIQNTNSSYCNCYCTKCRWKCFVCSVDF